MKKLLFSLVLLTLLAAGCSSTPQSSAPNKSTSQNNQNSQNSAPTPTKADSKYTMAEVKAVNSAQKCWSVVDGSVYDLTNWINKHPGGKTAIESMCGKDSTAAFNAQHGSQKRPEQELSKYKIGTLSK